MEYIRLTEEQQDGTGRSIITCRFKGTERCCIHNCSNCGNCDVFNKILEQLHEFESMWDELEKLGAIQHSAN